jgi:hypothetical protein
MAIPGISGGKIAQTTSEVGGPSLVANLNNKLADSAIGSVFDALAPKASEIFETRTATRIFNSHQSIGVEEVKGSRLPEFTENENLYGFTIFQFKKGFLGGGWAPAVINSLLGYDISTVTNAVLGSDDISSVNSYFFNFHPSSISVSEPYTTQLIPTQGGGVYAESQGSILRTLTLAGTTGYRPSISGELTNRLDNVIPHQIGEATGYLNFLKLRNVFRNYSDLKKNASQAYKTYMIWYNNKEQEAWFFEPSSFVTNRDASSPLTYNYNISGTLIQKVNFSTVVNTISPDPNSPHYQVAMMRRSAGIINGLVGKFAPAFGDNVVGEVLQATSSYLSLLDDLDRTITNTRDLVGGVLGTVPLLVGTITAVGIDLGSRFTKMIGPNFEATFNLPKTWANYPEMYGDVLNIDRAIRQANKAAAALAQPESLSELSTVSLALTGVENNSPVPKTQLAYGAAGQFFSDEVELVPYSATGDEESLEEISIKVTGDASAAGAIAEINGLTYPYVSSTPGYQSSNNSFIGQGTVIYIPFPKEITSGDINTRININKVTGNLNEQILGRDILLSKKTHGTTGVSEFNLAISPGGDLAIVSGRDNMVQAIDIKLNTERGELVPHPEFGIVPVVGHKGTKNLTFNLYLSLNDTMLSDGRIKELTDTFVSVSGGTATVKTKVNVVGRLPSVPLSFSMGQ